MRVLTALCCAAVITACLAPSARADEWNKKTYLTFSGPVQIPGTTLPAGTYLFQLADPNLARHVVMVASKDGTKVYGMFLTIPTDRLETPSENVVMFAETPAGTPQAIQAWWYPGDQTGDEFVYPKNQAVMIARANHRSVLATDTAVAANKSESERLSALRGSKVARVDEHGNINGEPAASNSAPPARATTPAPTNTVAENTAPPPAPRAQTAVATSGNTSTRTLPRTASSLPLIELLSALFILSGIGIRFVRNRVAAER